MIDWHSHILPGMDDGSKTVKESLAMLDALAEQGIRTVIATPHFYANEETVEDFLERRQAACQALSEQTGDRDVHILCGAEVRYYPGISRMEGLQRLAIGDSGLLLLEMPVARWTEFTVRELIELAGMRGLKIVLAHVERYISLQERETFRRLCESGILMQVNASFFERLRSRRKAVKLLKAGYVQFLGSDCHNMAARPPRIRPAYDVIRRKLGEELLSQMNEYGYHALAHKTQPKNL